jgi:CRISPR/Cas system-associated exonuclease Cas4 (RecB family)
MRYKDIMSLSKFLRQYAQEHKYLIPTRLSGLLQLWISDKVPSKNIRLMSKFISEYGDNDYEDVPNLLLSVDEIATKWYRKISISEIQAYRRCKLQHAYKYDMKIEPIDKDNRALRIGSWVHQIIEGLYGIGYDASLEDLNSLIYEVQLEAYDMIEKLGDDQEAIDNVKVDISIVEGAVTAYYNVLFLTEQEEGFSLSSINVEKTFEVPIGKSNKYIFHGRIDGLFDCRDGQKYIHEIKTKSGYGAIDKEQLEMDDQLTAYIWAMRKLGIDVAGVVYSVIKKPGLMRKKQVVYMIDHNDYNIHKIAYNKPDSNKIVQDIISSYVSSKIVDIETPLKKDKYLEVYVNDVMIGVVKTKTEAIKLINDSEPVRDFVDGIIVTTAEGLEDIETYSERIKQDYLQRPEFYVSRQIVFRDPQTIFQFERRIRQEAKEMAKNNMITAYPQPAESYINYCNLCDYRELCKVMYDPNTYNELLRTKYISSKERYRNNIERIIEDNTDYDIDF